MNYRERYEYNRRTMSDDNAAIFAHGRYKHHLAHRLNGAKLYNTPYFWSARLDRYDAYYNLDERRNWHASLAAIRYGVSTKAQRKQIASYPLLYRSLSGRGGTLRASAVLGWLNKMAGEEMFCLAEPQNSSRRMSEVGQLQLAEDMRRLYDGTLCFSYYATSSPHFPDLLFSSSDPTLVDLIVGVERGRYTATRVPRALAEMQGAQPLRGVIAERDGETVAAQLLERIAVTRTSGTNRVTDPVHAWVMPAVVAQHDRLFRAEFLRINYGRPPSEYHSSARFLRGQAELHDVTLGLEWEVGVPSSRRTILVNRVLNHFSKAAGTLDYVHAERDGSLNNQGVEFVFAYRSLDKHRAIISGAFESDAALPTRNRTMPRLTQLARAGIHVHVGISDAAGNSMTNTQIGMMSDVVTLDPNRDFMQALFGRGANNYVRYTAGLMAKHDPYDIPALLGGRYAVVNKRPQTVEIRGFRSDTSPEWLMLTLEFADALRHYACEFAGEDNIYETANAHNFVRWIIECESCYPNLINRLKDEEVFNALCGTPLPPSMSDADGGAVEADPLAFLRDLRSTPLALAEVA